MKTCFYCDEPIEPHTPIYMVAVEFPYANLWFHREHYKLIESTLKEYLTENYARLLKTIERKTK